MNNNNNSRSGVSSPSSDFPRKDIAGLVRLLKIMEGAGKNGISTTKLCEQAFKTRNYSMRVIDRAYDDGYIKRYGKGKHAHKKINYLSEKGKELLSQLQQQQTATPTRLPPHQQATSSGGSAGMATTTSGIVGGGGEEDQQQQQEEQQFIFSMPSRQRAIQRAINARRRNRS